MVMMMMMMMMKLLNKQLTEKPTVIGLLIFLSTKMAPGEMKKSCNIVPRVYRQQVRQQSLHGGDSTLQQIRGQSLKENGS